MAKIRIYELAREIAEGNEQLDAKVLSADIVKKLQEQGSDIKNATNSISDEEADGFRKAYAKKASSEKKKTGNADGNTAESRKSTEAKEEKPVNAANAETDETRNAEARSQEKPVAQKTVESGEASRDNRVRQGDRVGQNGGKRPVEGKIKRNDGTFISYAVASDGRLVNVADRRALPFKMGADGNIYKMDGTLFQKRSQQGQAAKPMQQSFDGRSPKDRQKAERTGNGNQNKGAGQQHGTLTENLADKFKAFEGQFDSAPAGQPVQPKKKINKADIQLPVMPSEEIAPSEEPVKAPAEAPVAENEQKNEAKPAGNEAKPEKKTINIIGNIFDSGYARENQNNSQNNNRSGNRENAGSGSRDGQRQGGYNRDGQRQGGYNRDGQRQGGYNRDGQRQGGNNRDGQGQGGYNRDGQRQGGYNRDGQRQGGYNRDGQGQGGYNRDGQRQGGYNRDGQQGGYNRGGQGFDRGGQGFGDKDKDDNQRRNFTRKTDNRPSGGSAKSELAKELGKDKRAESIKNSRNYKNNDRRDRADFDEDGLQKGKKDPNRKGAFQKPVAKPVVEEEEIKTIEVGEVITIKELADKMKQPSAAIIKKLFLAGKMYNLNSEITFEEAEEIALDYEIICEKEVKVNVVEELLREGEEDQEQMVKRPPVVCVMGHVDHGKTSLLDAIRKTNVTAREAGGITQHIGAYMVEINDRKITFLDTPGHEAFTSMRMRGAQSTDIAILVVAADDGVMPQTIEAINHAKAAGVSIIVAVNKIDKPGANLDRVKQELTEHELVAEDWGGDTVLVPVSAKTGDGIENLLEMVLLTADVLELKANPNRKARGIVIEAKLDKGRGPVATVLVQKGTLNVGDNVVIGSVHGKVRAMVDDKGRKVKTATPSTPVELLGLNGVPQAGETMLSVADEKEARTIAEAFIAQSKEELIAESKKQITLENMFSQMHEGELKNLNLIIKADVMGSVEAVKQSLLKLTNEEVAVRVIHGGVGNINESDVNLAAASDAIIIGFNVKPDNTAKEISEREKVDVRLYRVIYDAIDDIELAMKGMLKPIYQEKVIAHAEVRQLFKASGVGTIAGSFVLDGKIQRGSMARISREGTQIWEGNLASLKRFKDDVKEVAAGYECGLVFEKFSDLAELDQVEFYIMEEIPRK